MEDRKSVLETVKPADALGRLASRSHASKVTMIVIAVLVFFGVAILIGSIFMTTRHSTDYQALPSVTR